MKTRWLLVGALALGLLSFLGWYLSGRAERPRCVIGGAAVALVAALGASSCLVLAAWHRLRAKPLHPHHTHP